MAVPSPYTPLRTGPRCSLGSYPRREPRGNRTSYSCRLGRYRYKRCDCHQEPVACLARLVRGSELPYLPLLTFLTLPISLPHFLSSQIENFYPLEVVLGPYEKIYYPLRPYQPRSPKSKDGGNDPPIKYGLVVEIDRQAAGRTPTVTLRSPVQVRRYHGNNKSLGKT